MALLRLWVLRIPKTVDAPASALPLPDLMALPVAAAAVEAGVAKANEQGTKNPTAGGTPTPDTTYVPGWHGILAWRVGVAASVRGERCQQWGRRMVVACMHVCKSIKNNYTLYCTIRRATARSEVKEAGGKGPGSCSQAEAQ
jgi:hypothetical protein